MPRVDPQRDATRRHASMQRLSSRVVSPLTLQRRRASMREANRRVQRSGHGFIKIGVLAAGLIAGSLTLMAMRGRDDDEEDSNSAPAEDAVERRPSGTASLLFAPVTGAATAAAAAISAGTRAVMLASAGGQRNKNKPAEIAGRGVVEISSSGLRTTVVSYALIAAPAERSWDVLSSCLSGDSPHILSAVRKSEVHGRLDDGRILLEQAVAFTLGPISGEMNARTAIYIKEDARRVETELMAPTYPLQTHVAIFTVEEKEGASVLRVRQEMMVQARGPHRLMGGDKLLRRVCKKQAKQLLADVACAAEGAILDAVPSLTDADAEPST